MAINRIHTPEGVRDIYNVEYRKKQYLEQKLQKVFHLFVVAHNQKL